MAARVGRRSAGQSSGQPDRDTTFAARTARRTAFASALTPVSREGCDNPRACPPIARPRDAVARAQFVVTRAAMRAVFGWHYALVGQGAVLQPCEPSSG